MPLWLRVWKDDDLAPVVDTLRALMLDGTIRDGPADHQHRPARLGVLQAATQWWHGAGADPRATSSTKIARELEIGRWMMRFALYGDEAVVDHRFAKIKARLRAHPRAPRSGAPSARPRTSRASSTRPSASRAACRTSSWNDMTGWYGGEEGGHIGFSPVAPLTGRDALAVRDLLRGMIEEAGPRLHGRRSSRSTRAASSTSRWSSSTPRTRRRRARAYDVDAGGSCARRPSRATASTARTWTSWTSRPTSTASTTTPTGASPRRSRTRSTPTASSRPGKQGIWPKAMRDRRGT